MSILGIALYFIFIYNAIFNTEPDFTIIDNL